MPMMAVSLPIYVLLPKYYADAYGVPLTLIGIVLLIARMIDILQDPIIGWWMDKKQFSAQQMRDLIMIVAPFAAAGFVLLVHPAMETVSGKAFWMAALMVFTYSALSMVTVAYHSITMTFSDDVHDQTRIHAMRESFGMLGVVIATFVPTLLSSFLGMEVGLSIFSIFIVPWMIGAAYLTFRYSPQAPKNPLRVAAKKATAEKHEMFESLHRNSPLMWLSIVYFLTSCASAIPATALLFYVESVLGAGGQSAFFLALYFLGGVLGMPVWITLSDRLGARHCWMVALSFGVLIFLSMIAFRPDDAGVFYLMCALAGVCMGADHALPYVMMTQMLRGNRQNAGYFGTWSFLAKLALALGGGVALYLLGSMAYDPQATQHISTHARLMAVTLVFAFFPCLIKFAAMLLLWFAPMGQSMTRKANVAG